GDVFRIRLAAAAAVAAIRAGDSGPRYLECITSRWLEHVGPGEDFDLGFRTREETKSWRDTDQIKLLRGLIPEPARAEIEASVAAEIADAFAFAEKSPFPGPEGLSLHLFH